MIRYRQLTDAELAERDGDKPKPVKRSALKRQHAKRQTEKPPRKIAKRHAAPRKP